MRNYLKESGLSAVILVSIAAIAFLNKNAAQWVILGAIVVFVISKSIIYCINHKDDFAEKKEHCVLTVKRHRKVHEIPLDFKYAVNQLSHRITDRLHSAFPESTWCWTDKPTAKIFTDGGRMRIVTSKTENFNEADVILDSYGRIEIKMIEASSVSDIIKATDENADTDFTIDAQIWYEQCAQKVLTDIITELNAKGTKVLSINKDGGIIIEDDKQIGILKAFPTKNLWKKLIGIFEENGLMAVENENSIQIGW